MDGWGGGFCTSVTHAAKDFTPGAGANWQLPQQTLSPMSFTQNGSVPFSLISSVQITAPRPWITPPPPSSYWGASGIILEATRKLMKSFSISKHDHGRMFYLQVIVRSTKEREGDKGAVRERRQRMERRERRGLKKWLPIEDSTHGKRVNNAALHTARRLCGAIAMATPFPSHIFNEKVMRET